MYNYSHSLSLKPFTIFKFLVMIKSSIETEINVDL